MKDHVELGHLAKYGAFRMNRDQVMDLETWFKIHTGVSNMIFHVVVSVHRLVKFETHPSSLLNFGTANRNVQLESFD